MKYRLKQIGVRPWTLNGLSLKLIESHYENNYGGALRRLNAITGQLESLDFASTPGHVLSGLKREQLVALNSTLLHELYFSSMGGDGQATTSQPSVGTYLDEQPITTVQGNLDVHLYDIARVEALAGPQGTLYGASSQAGTIRIITNKPDPSGFAAGYSLEGNFVDADDVGYVAEGFVNLPVGDNAAIRLVGCFSASCPR